MSKAQGSGLWCYAVALSVLHALCSMLNKLHKDSHLLFGIVNESFDILDFNCERNLARLIEVKILLVRNEPEDYNGKQGVSCLILQLARAKRKIIIPCWSCQELNIISYL